MPFEVWPGHLTITLAMILGARVWGYRLLAKAEESQARTDSPALGIRSTKSMSSSPEVAGAPGKKRERREDPATHAFYLAARASGKDLAGMPTEVRRLTPEQAREILRRMQDSQDAK